MTRPYDPFNPQDNLTETEAKIEGDLNYGLELITRMLPAPVSMAHLEENLVAGIHYLTQAAEAMGYDMSAPFPQSGPQRPEWDLREVWQVLYRYHTEPVAESQLGEILNAVRRTREADKYAEPSVFDSSDR